MEQKEALIQDSTSIFEEIEIQLDALLSEKRRKIQEDLENKIEVEKKEAEDQISMLEKELTEERDSLNSYRLTMTEYENDKKKIKDKIREHLAKAMEYQPQIESLTAQTFDELKKVMELNKQLEEIHAAAASVADSVKQKLEDKYGIKPPVSETFENDDVQFNLDGELEKLKKIKELLGQNSYEISDNDDGNHDSNLVTSPIAEDVKEELATEEEFEKADEEELTLEEDGTEDQVEMEGPLEEMESVGEDTQVKEDESEIRVEIEDPVEEIESSEEEAQAEKEESEAGVEAEEVAEEMEKVEESSEEIEVLMNNLESFRKVKEGDKNIKLTYFESGNKKLLDGREVVDTIAKTITEADGLFNQLTGSDSPKEQFFSKQEILWHQETLREYVQEASQMCEKDQAAFPEFLDKVFNLEVLKDLYSRLSQENWSNATNYSSFKEHIEELKAEFLDKSTPQLAYLQSLTDELNQG